MTQIYIFKPQINLEHTLQKIFFITVLFTFVSVTAVQAIVFDNTTSTQTDTIRLEEKPKAYTSFQNGLELNIKQLQSFQNVIHQAVQNTKTAQSSNTLATIFSYAGGFLIGWPIGTAIAGGKPNWVIAGVGVGLVGISVILIHDAKNKARKVVNEHNSSITSNTSTYHKELKIGITSNGVGLVYKF